MRYSQNPDSIKANNRKKLLRLKSESQHTLKAVALLCSLVGSYPIYAENVKKNEVYTFNISGGNISSVLNKLAETANIELNYQSELTGAVNSNGLNGSYTVEQALQHILKGTGLNYRMTGDDSITVEKSPESHLPQSTLSPETLS